MKARRTINKLAGRSAGRLAGALGLLLGLCLVAGGVVPAYAIEPPPEMPHQFYGTVSRDGAPVAQGTLVEAFVGGVKQAETTVDGVGRYGYVTIFRVPGTAGATVTFKVGGVLANETATWESGKVQQLNLTINEPPGPPVPRYSLTMAATPTGSGNATDLTNASPYLAGTVVSIKAEPAAGYGFVNWTAPAGTFGNVTAAETTFTMPAQNVTVTAYFGVVYNLTMAADPVVGGSAIDVAAKGAYAAGAQVRIKAVANPGYRFGNWTATVGEFGNVTAAETTFTMPAQNVTVTAHFEEAPPVPEVPMVTTQAATDISSYSGTVRMSYTVGNSSSVEVRFACKRLTDPAWFYTTWVSRTADGNYTEVLTGLLSQTDYEFKAQLRYDSTVIEGATYQFTTCRGTSTNLSDLLGSFGCFIATAAYGTPTAEQIDVLREFRDVVLLKNAVGRLFVALYYQLSPPIADVIAGNEFLRSLVREFLIDPIVWVVRATGDIWRN